MKKPCVGLLMILMAAMLSAVPPEHSVSIPPSLVMQSWYDYMIGSYSNLPMHEIPQAFGGGRIMTYHAKRTLTGVRKVWFSYIDDQGQMATVVDPWQDVNAQMGYPGMAIDRTLGKPFYVWHQNMDTDTQYEIPLMWEFSPVQTPGLYSTIQNVFDPPNLPPGHENDEFIWPSVQVGPSPNAGMRRIYVLARNYSQVGSTSENVMVAYADYNDAMLMNDQSFTWSYTSIPTLDDWHNNTDPIWRRMSGALAVGNDGRIFYAGYHYASELPDYEHIEEPEVDVFVCDNYGEGTWQYFSVNSRVPSYNPFDPIQMVYAFYDDADQPIPDEQIYYKATNNGHFNVTLDSEGKLHIPGVWSLRIGDPTAIFRNTSTLKEVVFDPDTHMFSIHEIYPKAGGSSDNLWWMPWDADGDHYADFWPGVLPQPMCEFHFPYGYWDETANDDAMVFHHNYVRLTEEDDSGAMACLWMDSYKAQCYHKHPADYPQYQPWENAPEIMISVSPDRGASWSEPIVLSSVDTPTLSGMIPMWVYPSNRFTDVTSPDGDPLKRLWLMFLDDDEWGMNLPPWPQIDSGNIMYMAIDIAMPVSANAEEPVPVLPVNMMNYPNPFNPSTTIRFELSKSGLASISIYNVKGQLVRSFPSETLQAGTHELTWDGTDNSGKAVGSGVYLARMVYGGGSTTHRMMLMK